MTVVLVGALNVGSIDTVWRSAATPVELGDIHTFKYDDPPVILKRGEELGRFNLGSTVILLFPPGRVVWDDGLAPGVEVRMGRAIGRRTDAEAGED